MGERVGVEAAERPVSKAVARIFGRLVDPAETTIVKLAPTSPPLRGTIVLVDDVRCRVTRAKVTWDGPRWTIRSLRVRAANLPDKFAEGLQGDSLERRDGGAVIPVSSPGRVPSSIPYDSVCEPSSAPAGAGNAGVGVVPQGGLEGRANRRGGSAIPLSVKADDGPRS